MKKSRATFFDPVPRTYLINVCRLFKITVTNPLAHPPVNGVLTNFRRARRLRRDYANARTVVFGPAGFTFERVRTLSTRKRSPRFTILSREDANLSFASIADLRTE